MDFTQQYKKELENELTQFLFLCGKADGRTLIAAATKNNLDDKLRLVCITVILGYKKYY